MRLSYIKDIIDICSIGTKQKGGTLRDENNTMAKIVKDKKIKVKLDKTIQIEDITDAWQFQNETPP